MEVKPVVAVVIQKLVDTLTEESIADNKVMIHQLKGVQKSLEKLRSFSKEKDHLRVVYEIEDEIEKFTFRVARQRKRFGFLMKHTFFFNNVNSCCKLKRKIRKIRSTISSFREDEASIRSISTTSSPSTPASSTSTAISYLNSMCCNGTNVLTQKSSSDIWPIIEIPSTPSPKRGWMTRSFSTITNQKEHGLQRKKLTFSFSSNEEEKNMVGFKHLSNVSYQEEVGVFGQIDDIKSLVRRLTQQTEMFVPIVGDVGCGKTTLARAVYRNRKIRDHFESHDWISVTEDYDAERVLLSVSKKVDMVKGKRYLIVVDGIGSCGVLKDLKNAFPDENNGSKVVFISRTGPEMSMNSHTVEKISEEESWTMFLKKAGKEKEAEQIEPCVKDKILDICKGLPLNIVLMAGLLTSKIPTRWSESLMNDHDQHSNDVLNLCYNDLAINSKLCLLYMSLFPKDYDIPVRRLLRLWLAEGFVKRRSRRSKHPLPEDLVQKCFEELVDRNIIQITKLRSDNSPRQCRLVSVFHDYLLPKAQDISLFYIHRNSENYEDAAGTFGVRRMVQHLSTTGAFDHQQSQRKSPTFDPSLLRSYISFNFQRKDMPEREVGILLNQVISRNFSLLRVLDLEGVCKPSLPNKLGRLRHLRYLGLRWTFLESIPESVGDLSYLETLDVKHTRVDTLPDSIWKLKRLRHLNLNNIRLAMPPSSSLTLLTLWGLVLDEKISISQGLGKLRDLRELGIKFHLNESQGALLDWIAKLVSLQSLRLTSVDEMGRPSKLVMKPLTALDKLSHLNLYGNLQKLPDLNEFPPTVKVLTLSISRLNNDPMETLEQLPCLIVLRLLGDSFTGKRMVCHRKGFQKLEVLKLWKLTGLEEWDVEDEAMTSLKQLDIRCCHKLKNISSRLLLKPRRLEELELTDMPDDFVARIKKRKSNDTSLTVNPWKFNK
ncbi:putative disease resistance RPP13-like protein 2 [Tanacetum coccineum]